jgi:hypothetical protein
VSNDYNGTTSVLTSDATQTWGSLITIAAWFDADTHGSSNAGRLYTQGATNRTSMRWNGGANKKLDLASGRATADGHWEMTTGFGTLAGWKWVAVTYDDGNVANDPIMYTWDGTTFSTLTVGSGLTEAITPNGAVDTDNQTVTIGGGASLFWDGRIAEFAMWKRLLSANEVAGVFANGVNVCPDHFVYLPQDGGVVQNLGSSGTTFTASNLSAAENPPTRPAGRKG